MAGLATTKVNNKVVKAIPIDDSKKDRRPVKGVDVCSEVYANIALIAKKKKGKTSIIYKLIQECAGRDTNVIAFVSTLNKDAQWTVIKEYCEKKGIPFVGYTSLYNEEKVDMLAALVAHLQEEEIKEPEPESKAPVARSYIRCAPAVAEESKAAKPRPTKYVAPEYIIILDDLSDELKATSITALLKKNRHFKSKVIISTQWVNDIQPQSLKQIDLLILFSDHSAEKIEEIHNKTAMSIPLDQFQRMYHHATSEPHSFLWIDLPNATFRKNFTHLYT